MRQHSAFASQTKSPGSAEARVVDITLAVESVERVTVVGAKGESVPNSVWQIRGRDEVTSERYEVGIALVHDASAVAIKRAP